MPDRLATNDHHAHESRADSASHGHSRTSVSATPSDDSRNLVNEPTSKVSGSIKSSSPLTIMFGITELDPGGAEQNFVELICRLDRRRWNPIVVVVMPIQPAKLATTNSTTAQADKDMSANIASNEPPHTLTDRLRESGIAIHSLNVRSTRDFWRGWSAWTKLIRTHQPAALLTFLFHANLLGRRLAAGRPTCDQ